MYIKTARKYTKDVYVVFSGDFLFSTLYFFAFSQFFYMSLGYFHNQKKNSISEVEITIKILPYLIKKCYFLF